MRPSATLLHRSTPKCAAAGQGGNQCPLDSEFHVGDRMLYMVATGQEMVRENKNSPRSGKSQGILFWVRENWHFEQKSGKIEIVRLS